MISDIMMEEVTIMSILGAIMTPHPPLIIPQVGRGQEDGIAATTAAMHRKPRALRWSLGRKRWW